MMQERDKLISRETNNITRSAESNSSSNLRTLDALVGKEARRLEKDLRNQLRFYEAIERANINQINRESGLVTIEAARLMKRQRSIKLQKIKSEEVRHFRESKERLHRQISKRLDSDFQERRAAFAEHLAGEDARVVALQQSCGEIARERSERWKNKLERMRNNAAEVFRAREELGGSILERFDSRVQLFERRKSAEIKQKMLKHEEATLRLIEAKDKRDRLQRLEDLKKREIATSLEKNLARVESLIATREEIVKQRKLIIREQESVHGRPLPITNITPGPGDYYPGISSVNEHPAPRISCSKPKLLVPGSTDFELRRSQEVPPLGAYNPKVMRTGRQTWDGVKFSLGKSKRTTYLDELRDQKKFLPGPGAYMKLLKPAVLSTGGPRFVREYFRPEEDKTKHDIPGPGAYTIDAFTRQVKLAKSQTSVEALAQALRISVPA